MCEFVKWYLTQLNEVWEMEVNSIVNSFLVDSHSQSKTTQNKAPTSCDLPRPEVDEGKSYFIC